ncbi:MAG: hypothetical protein UZ09_BCD002000232 [Bacteroidetes bacterium OLB9]|nr:MAG: hypothetical protein UZ09_BCD002000232 [Bacteroidetes bacterium OLB9]MCZ2336698.1 hypothetical protein [Chitinophagales bacterium]
MKILIISNAFSPTLNPRSFRTTELVKEFCRQGNDVTIMMPYHPEYHDPIKLEFGFKIVDLGRKKFPPIKISKIPVLNFLTRALSRLLLQFFEYPNIEIMFQVKNKLKNLNEKFDLLISIAEPYPIHWGIALSQRDINEITDVWIADCGDPYYGQENNNYNPPFYFAFIEKWFMRKANYITVPTEGSKNGYFPEFKNKLVVIPQGFKFKKYIGKRLVSSNILHFVYGGSFIPNKRDPKEFIEFLNSLPSDTKYRFDIYTNTPHWAEMHSKQNKNIFIQNPVPREEFLNIASAADFVVNFANKGDIQTPSKLIDYAIIDKPILNIVTGNLDSENITRFLKRDFTNSYKIENVDQYKIENICKQFLCLIKD